MFPDKLVYNYSIAVLNIAGDKINKIIDDINALNALSIKLQARYNEKLFNERSGQQVLVELVSSLKLEKIAVNLFIKLLLKRRLILLAGICNYLPIIVKEKAGIYAADVVSTRCLNSDELNDVSNKLSDIFDKKFEINNIINPSMLAGVSVRFGSYLLDNSFIGKLQRAKKYLSEHKLELQNAN